MNCISSIVYVLKLLKNENSILCEFIVFLCLKLIVSGQKIFIFTHVNANKYIAVPIKKVSLLLRKKSIEAHDFDYYKENVG